MEQAELLAVILLIISAGCASLYAFVQKITDELFLLFTALNIIAIAIGLCFLPFVGMLPAQAFPYFCGASFSYTCALLIRDQCLKRFDLSQFYGTNAVFISFWIVMASVFLFGESLNLYGWMAIALTLMGVFVLAMGAKKSIIPFCALSGLATGSAFLFDTRGIQASGEPFTYIVWNLFAGFPVVLIGFWRYGGRTITLIRERYRPIALATFSDLSCYALLLYVVYSMQVLYVLPLTKLDIVFTAIIAMVILKEPHGYRRIAASILIVFGVVIMQLFGQGASI